MTIFGDGKQQRAFSYIGDIAPHVARSLLVKEARNKVFNIGADHPYSVNELAESVAEAMGVFSKIIYLPPRKEVMVAFTDHSACHRVFGNGSQTSLEKGLQCMADWVKGVGARKSKEFENIEIYNGLPSAWVSPIQGTT